MLIVGFILVMKSLEAKFLRLLQHCPKLFEAFAQDVNCKIFPSSRARTKI